jgi:FMN reductase
VTGRPVRATLLVGHPTPGSRTLAASCYVTGILRSRLADHHVAVGDPQLVDLSELAPGLLGAGEAGPPVAWAYTAVRRAGLLVVASPTFKASYTGLLKLFLDALPRKGLAGAVAVPLMTALGVAHRYAVDTHLRSLLVELGATVPTPGLSVLEADLGALDHVFDEWSAESVPVLAAVLGRSEDRPEEQAAHAAAAGPGRTR